MILFFTRIIVHDNLCLISNTNNCIYFHRNWIKPFFPKCWFPRRGNVNVQLYITHSYSAMFIQTYYFFTKKHWMKTFCFCTFSYEIGTLRIQEWTFIHERKTSFIFIYAKMLTNIQPWCQIRMKTSKDFLLSKDIIL